MRLHLFAAVLLTASPAFAVSPEQPDPVDRGAQAAQQARVQDDKAHRLDVLFAELQAASTTADGKAIEQRILLEWHRSGDDEVDNMFNAALLAMDIKAFGTAIAVLDRVIAAKPDFAEGWNKRATVYYYVNEYERSLADIERTLALEPRHFGALAGLGMIMQDTGNIPGAIAAFEEAVAVNPSLTNLKEAIGRLRARIGRDI